MAQPGSTLARDYAAMDDAALVDLVLRGDRQAFRDIMRRCNQRLFRVARGVVNDDAEAEDVVQAAYVDAFAKLGDFRGQASLLTWLTRIVLNECYGRLRKRRPVVDIDQVEALQVDNIISFPEKFGNEDPAALAARDQARQLIEHAVDRLPEPFRIVFVMREIEDCTVEETAVVLELRPETVKTRLHRARRLLRAQLNDALSATLADAFPFLGTRCDRMTAAVMQRLERTFPPATELRPSSTTGEPTC
ncbi:RNA polymerase sigma factor [Lysobacter niastensis]|uniref:RNA polymerase sigma factor n=1 Tax=Lysobacter niastensis TaxID=380629 RepID=A0ABS0B620_9GAMM|nr:RNA polymerase sigma factor [Lysobacter niastensis]MBF6024425.1 RNA polymerase sigma factor [Lysobacter niastensis]